VGVGVGVDAAEGSRVVTPRARPPASEPFVSPSMGAELRMLRCEVVQLRDEKHAAAASLRQIKQSFLKNANLLQAQVRGGVVWCGVVWCVSLFGVPWLRVCHANE